MNGVEMGEYVVIEVRPRLGEVLDWAHGRSMVNEDLWCPIKAALIRMGYPISSVSKRVVGFTSPTGIREFDTKPELHDYIDSVDKFADSVSYYLETGIPRQTDLPPEAVLVKVPKWAHEQVQQVEADAYLADLGEWFDLCLQESQRGITKTT